MHGQLRGAKLMLANGNPIEELRFGKGRELALSGSTGEINAYSKKDLMQNLSGLMQAMASGQIVHAQPEQQIATAADRREMLAEARQSPEKWNALGASIAQQIYDQTDREGFMRKLAVGNTLRQGEVQRVPMPAHDTSAVVATSATGIGYQNIRQRVFTPEEFEIIANVRVNTLDLEQVNGDLLEHAYNDGLQSIMVAEDRIWKTAADLTVGVINPMEYIAGELTTKNLGRLRQAVAGHNLPVAHCLIANDFWTDIIGSNDFATFLDPITKYDLALNGQLGTLVGMTLITDAFRQPNQKVLAPGEIYVVASAENHAAYSTRGGVRSEPASNTFEGSTSRGWLMSEPFSFVLANSRSVAKGKRVA